MSSAAKIRQLKGMRQQIVSMRRALKSMQGTTSMMQEAAIGAMREAIAHLERAQDSVMDAERRLK